MSGVDEQRDLEILGELRDRPEAVVDPTSTTAVAGISMESVRNQLRQPVSHWREGIRVLYRPWKLRDQKHASWSPVRLFLLFFQCILNLLVHHTTINARADPDRKMQSKDITDIEMRRWVACRLQMINSTPKTADMQDLWSVKGLRTRRLGFQRFKVIEWYLSVCLKQFLQPGSHLVVDESSIEFHGRKRDKYRMSHKPAGEGFCIYALCSYGGMIHDFAVSSSQEGIEGVLRGIEVNIAARTVRERAKGTNNGRAAVVDLPPQKAVIWILCDRSTRQWRLENHVCYIDNLFTDIPLAKALLAINFGVCGTTRKNTPGFPPVLLAVKHKYPRLLPPGHRTAIIVEDIAVCMAWKDAHRRNIVSLISTVHDPRDSELALRRTRSQVSTRATPGGFTTASVLQPKIAVDYTRFMGALDLFNRLRTSQSVRRPHQDKWTKKWIEFLIDLCHTVAFLIWVRYQVQNQDGRRLRKQFITELIDGLVEVEEEVHTPRQVSKRNHCAWKDCRSRGHSRRDPLGEVINSSLVSQHCRVDTYCDKCVKYLCTDKGCWTSYHDAHNLIIRPEDRH